MSTSRKNYVPHEIDDVEDRMGDIQPLDFSDDDAGIHSGRPGETQLSPERERIAGMSGGEALSQGSHEDGVNFDDLSPETLIDEDGQSYDNDDGPMDRELTVVNGQDIGAGTGLDEAELGRARPLDGKPWDGPEDSLGAEGAVETLRDDDSVGLSDDELDGAALDGDALLNSSADRG